ncbi:tyrosine-type recombinase/integrase [Nonomuraea sp. NPDC049129]|uniref:tyrosine-type recombinase/integrase n=1 Tax=Nonomuraea sp. NPDC049129 TaxID=3155272 RepID=UPI0033FF04BA
MTAAVERFLESVQAATTRAGYAETLARLTAVTGPQYPVAAHALRERLLWRLLYDTAARAEEVLTLNVEDLDLEFRRARVVSKGGAIEYVHWATPTARLLPRLLTGHTRRTCSASRSRWLHSGRRPWP